MKFHYSIVFVIFTLIIFFSCKSVPQKEVSNDYEISKNMEEQAVSLAMPNKAEDKGMFSQIDSSILDLVENGTSSDLISAISKLRSPDQVYTDEQLVLLNVISGMLSVAYPNEKISWPIPPVSVENNYTAALDSAKKGVYDYSTGNSDFLSLCLPSLILFTTPSVKNYYAESEKSLKAALKINPDSFLVCYMLGILFSRQGRQYEAIDNLEKAYKIDNSCISLAQIYAIELMKDGKTSLATEISQKILQQDPNNSEILKVSAYSYYTSGKLVEAEQYVIRILQQEPDNSEFILLRAKILMDRGEYLTVSSLLDLYARTDNFSKDYLLLRAKLQRDWNKNTSAALVTIQDALSRYPDDNDVLLFASSLMVLSGQKIGNRDVLDLLSQVLAKDSNNVEAMELSINEYVRIENWQKAYELSSQLIKAHNDISSALLMHVKICIKLGYVSEARKTLSLINSKNDETSYNLANVQILIAEGNKTEASRVIQSSLSSSISAREKSSFYYEKSRVSSSSDQKLADLRSSLTSNPRNNEALFDLYLYYFTNKDYRKAQYYLKQVVALNPRNQNLISLNEQLESLLAN